MGADGFQRVIHPVWSWVHESPSGCSCHSLLTMAERRRWSQATCCSEVAAARGWVLGTDFCPHVAIDCGFHAGGLGDACCCWCSICHSIVRSRTGILLPQAYTKSAAYRRIIEKRWPLLSIINRLLLTGEETGASAAVGWWGSPPKLDYMEKMYYLKIHCVIGPSSS